MIGLAIVNPVYFFCMMIGAMNNLKMIIAIVGGVLLGPIFFTITAEWAILYAGLISGSAAYIFGGKNGLR